MVRFTPCNVGGYEGPVAGGTLPIRCTMPKRKRQRSRRQGISRDLRPWLYGRVPVGFWDVAENRHRYMEWLGQQLGFRQPEDWYKVNWTHFRRNRGGGLLSKFNTSPGAAVKDFLPGYDWKEWLFSHAPQRFWSDPNNRRRYMNWLGQQLGFRRPEDWYRLTGAQLFQHAGYGLIKYCGYPILVVLKEYWPGYEWQEWRLAVVPTGFWDDPANRRRYLDWLGEQLGFREVVDWYGLKNEALYAHHGRPLSARLGHSPRAVATAYHSEYDWKE